MTKPNISNYYINDCKIDMQSYLNDKEKYFKYMKTKTLQEVKNKIANKYSNHLTWEAMMSHDFEYGVGASKYYSPERLWDEVCEEYSELYRLAFLNLGRAISKHLGEEKLNGLLVSGSYGKTDLDLQELYDALKS